MGLQKIYPFSREQYQFLTQSIARINVCDGPVRAGKNFVENIRFKNYLKSEPYENPRGDIAFCGVTKESVYRNFLRDLFRIIGEKNYTFNRQLGRGTIYGREFQVFSFKDADDFKALQGCTLSGAYVTETAHCHPDFFNELLARCMLYGAMIFCDLNPASPTHWFYTDFLTNEKLLATGFLRRFQFNFDSNLSMTAEDKAFLMQSYVPGSLRFKRMIQGLWVAAEGVIFTAFDHARNTIDPLLIPHAESIWLPFDFGIQHPTVFGKFVQHKDSLYLADMFRHHGGDDDRKTNNDYIEHMRDFMAGIPDGSAFEPNAIIRDPAPIAAAFNVQLGQEFDHIPQILANNDLLEGIDSVQLALQQGLLKVSLHPNCKPAIRGFGGYIWDKPASARTGNDVPLKKDDDEMCMVRYGVHTVRKMSPMGSAWEMIDDELAA